MRAPELSLGEWLSRGRAATNISVSESSRRTGLSKRFIRYVEADAYEQLEHSIYTLRGIQAYARVLGLDEAEAKHRYLEERGRLTPGLLARFSRPHSTPIVTSSLFFGAIVAFLGLVIIAYLGYQVILATGSPDLSVVFPRENQVVYTRSIELVGRTEPGSSVFIDGQSVAVTEDGSFRHEVTLPKGRHMMRIQARNDFGNSTEITRHFTIKAGTD